MEGYFHGPRTEVAGDGDIGSAALDERPSLARLVIAAEIRLYREGLCEALANRAEIDVLASTRDCAELERCLREIRPHVLLVDSGMAGCLATTKALADAAGTRVVVLGVRGLPDEVGTLAEAGVVGYVTRDETFERLVEVILSVARGEMPCSPEVSGHLMRRLASLAAGMNDLPLTRLTRREREVLGLIEKGLANKEIAGRLSIQLATVKNHVRSILDKLEVHSRGEAAAVSRRQG